MQNYIFVCIMRLHVIICYYRPRYNTPLHAWYVIPSENADKVLAFSSIATRAFLYKAKRHWIETCHINKRLYDVRTFYLRGDTASVNSTVLSTNWYAFGGNNLIHTACVYKDSKIIIKFAPTGIPYNSLLYCTLR